MNWIQRLAHLERKHRRLVTRRNVRAFRKRQANTGVRRVDAALTAHQYAILVASKRPGETFGAAVGRLLETISGKAGSA